jgi:hypothetical protein
VDDLEESLRDVPLELTPEGARVHGAHAAYFGDEAAGTANEIKVTDAEVRAKSAIWPACCGPIKWRGSAG